MDEAEEASSPGSPLAVMHGCTCPIFDNAHGEGHLGAGLFVMTECCPLHGSPAARGDDERKADRDE